MSANSRGAGSRYTKYVKVNLPPNVHEELDALAAASMLGTGTFVRSLILSHLAKVEAAKSEKVKP